MASGTIKVTRTTRESRIVVLLDRNSRDIENKRKLNTPLPFFNHMLEHVAWRGEMNLAIDVTLDHFDLVHVITEDVGIAFGKAVKAYLDHNQSCGIIGYGSAFGTIDEALSRAVISFESRAYLDIEKGTVQLPERMEGINSEDLVAFLEGFVQGAQCTLHIDLLKGRQGHGHHIWESIFRALGMALYEALEERSWRQDMTAGVAGTIDYMIEVE